MTITSSVVRQFYRSPSTSSEELIRIPPTVIMSHNIPHHAHQSPIIKTKRRLNIWTVEEHERFLAGLEMFPKGPWKAIASVVATKTTRQTMTHSQKYRDKIRRLSAKEQNTEIASLDRDESSHRSKESGATPDAPTTGLVDGDYVWDRDGFEWDLDLDALLQELHLPALAADNTWIDVEQATATESSTMALGRCDS